MRRIVRLPEVMRLTGMKRTKLYEEMKRGSFPRSVPLGKKIRGWIEDEIAAHNEKVIAAREARDSEGA